MRVTLSLDTSSMILTLNSSEGNSHDMGSLGTKSKKGIQTLHLTCRHLKYCFSCYLIISDLCMI